MGQIIRSLASVCLSVCVSVIASAIAVLNRIWWNFARCFGARKLRSSPYGSKSDNAYPILPPIFITPKCPNAFSFFNETVQTLQYQRSLTDCGG